MSTFAEEASYRTFQQWMTREQVRTSAIRSSYTHDSHTGRAVWADGWVDVERYGEAKKAWLATFLDMEKGYPRTIRLAVCLAGSSRSSSSVFYRLDTGHLSQDRGAVSEFDGKKLRRSQDSSHDQDGIWMVSAWMEANRMVIGQHKVAEKSNEITAIPALLAQLDITGCVVTIDAMGRRPRLPKPL